MHVYAVPPHGCVRVGKVFVNGWGLSVCPYVLCGNWNSAPFSNPGLPFLHTRHPITHRVYLGPLLGEGGFAFVYACMDVQDASRRLVLKKLNVQDQAHKVGRYMREWGRVERKGMYAPCVPLSLLYGAPLSMQ